MKSKKNKKTIKHLFKIIFFSKTFLFFSILFLNCSFKPTDIVFKNLDLIPELLDKTDNIPHIPKKYLNEKTEKLYKQPVFPSVEGEQVAERVIDIKGILNDTILTTADDLKNLIPSAESIDYMFNLSNIGIIKKDGKKDSKKKSGGGVKIDFIQSNTKNVPININTAPVKKLPKKIPLPPGLNANSSKLEIKNPIKDIQINGLDEVMPKLSVGAPLKEADYDLDPIIHFFDDFMPSPSEVLDTPVLDVVP